jgi:murein DD-endopeptidase MepM/ murein hydrolase activator NlpD
MPRSGALKLAVPLWLIGTATAILLLGLAGARSTASTGPCSVPTQPTGSVPTGLDAEQTSVALQIVAAVKAFAPTSTTPHAAVIALATARQESGLRNLDYGDRDSLGAFQQRPSQGWGTPAEVMNVTHATTTFLEHLIRIQGWQTRLVTDVAADVQRPAPAYRGLYQRWVPLATRLTAQLWGNTGGSSSTNCSAPATPTPNGPIVYPVPPVYVGTDEHNWGGTGSHWGNWHTGTDFAVPCGTPVLAATAGHIEIDTSQPWAGRWLVKVVTGPTSLATWYAHMEALHVRPGQFVHAGEAIGEAGDLGNATGCHLHFEVHLHNGTIYGPDNVDPSRWLQTRASREAKRDRIPAK